MFSYTLFTHVQNYGQTNKCLVKGFPKWSDHLALLPPPLLEVHSATIPQK